MLSLEQTEPTPVVCLTSALHLENNQDDKSITSFGEKAPVFVVAGYQSDAILHAEAMKSRTRRHYI